MLKSGLLLKPVRMVWHWPQDSSHHRSSPHPPLLLVCCPSLWLKPGLFFSLWLIFSSFSFCSYYLPLLLPLSLFHYLSLSLFYSFTLSLFHSFPLSLFHFSTLSLCHSFKLAKCVEWVKMSKVSKMCFKKRRTNLWHRSGQEEYYYPDHSTYGWSLRCCQTFHSNLLFYMTISGRRQEMCGKTIMELLGCWGMQIQYGISFL